VFIFLGCGESPKNYGKYNVQGEHCKLVTQSSNEKITRSSQIIDSLWGKNDFTSTNEIKTQRAVIAAETARKKSCVD
jgi:hypothetical protein